MYKCDHYCVKCSIFQPTVAWFEELLNRNEQVYKVWHPSEKHAKDGRMGIVNTVSIVPMEPNYNITVSTCNGNYAGDDDCLFKASREQCIELFKSWFRI
jgi:hypothetical protein